MPFITIRVTKEGVTPEQKLALIESETDLDTDNWGVHVKT